MSKRKFILPFIVLILTITVVFFSGFKDHDHSLEKVKTALKELVESKELQSGTVSFTLLSPDGSIITSYNPQKSLTTASTMKAITTAAALELLGDTFRYKTLVGYRGKIENGKLTGDIIIKGEGDPTLGSSRLGNTNGGNALLKRWVEEIRTAGIKSINGNIIADPTAFNINTIPDGWIWTDIGNYYGAGASGLNFIDNSYKVFFKPDIEGQPAKFIRTEPEIPNLTFINQMKTGKQDSGDNGYIFGGVFSNQKYLSGTIPAGVKEFSIKGSIPDPALFLAYSLYKELNNAGIHVKGEYQNSQRESGESISGFTKIITHYSPALNQIVKVTNEESINLYAEAILNTMGKIKSGKPGSTKEGIEIMQKWLESKGIDQSMVFITDGSGLSPTNAVSSLAFAKIMHLQKENKSFFQSLPVAGKSGTLSRFCKGETGENRIFAKSGSFTRVMGYTGYVKTSSGKLLSFSILINNYSGRSGTVRRRVETLLSATTGL